MLLFYAVQEKERKVILKRVIIIDDEKFTHKIVQQFLASSGYEMVAFESGEEALNYLKADSQFDVILLDYLMAGIDGYETLRCLKKEDHTKNIPVIIITALDDEHEKKKLLAAGAADVLAKPLQSQIFIDTLRKCLGEGWKSISVE